MHNAKDSQLSLIYHVIKKQPNNAQIKRPSRLIRESATTIINKALFEPHHGG